MGLAHLFPTLQKMDHDVELQFKNKECRLYIANVVRHNTSIIGGALLKRNQMWVDTALTAGITHDQLVELIAAYWNHRFSKVVLSIVKGISDRCTHSAGPSFDQSAIQKAQSLLGTNDIVLTMHYKQYSWFLNNTIVGRTPTGFAQFFGQRAICDDGWIPKQTLVMSESAFEFKWGQHHPCPIELITGSGGDTIISRVEWDIRPLGWTFSGPVSPTNADLENPANWKQIASEPSGIVVLKP